MSDKDNPDIDIEIVRAEALDEMHRIWIEEGGDFSDEWERDNATHRLMDERAQRNSRSFDGPMVRPDYRSYIRSVAWRLRSNRTKAATKWKCDSCGASGPLDAHHKTYDRLGCEFGQDLRPLCRDCHRRIHGKVS